MEECKDNHCHTVRWQIPLSPHGYHSIAFEDASKETQDKFRELYPTSFYRELAAWFGISIASVKRLGKRLGLEKDGTAIRRRKMTSSTQIRMRLSLAMKRMREEQPERCAKIRKRQSETMKRHWRVARYNEAYAINLQTKLRPAPLSHSLAMFRYRMHKVYNYFYDLSKPWDICYDSLTQRRPLLEKRAIARGFRIVEGEG